MQVFKRVFTQALVILLIVGLCGCDVIHEIITSDVPDESITIDIGMAIPVTGKHEFVYGLPMWRGFNLARDEINSIEGNPVKINFIVEDDMSTLEGAIAAFERLVESGVPAIVGMPVSDYAQHTFRIAEENKIVAFSSVSAAAGLSGIGNYIFRAALATDKGNPSGVNITYEKLGYETVALIYNESDLYSSSSYEYLLNGLSALDVDIVTTQTFQAGDTDFTAQLTAIMELNPDVLFITGLGTEDAEVMIQGRALGITSQYIVPGLGLHGVEFAGEAAEGAIAFTGWFSELDNPINRAFLERFQLTHGRDPEEIDALSYATIFILYHAIIEAMAKDFTSVPDSTAIRDELATVRDFDTNLGSFSFDSNGEAVYEPAVLIVENGIQVLF